ncbi:MULTISPECIES: ATP-binding cassette domain-containing protein [Nocardiopsis]|uniref:Caunorubicin/doxorubicin resistance ATP-binding protein n=1 Tax=Nocardiopsis sinuspersici TaxID=501010 RepID=A0A1V3BYL6_9ACTN|nr:MULTISPECIES: ATP-binding cassette domain-containing protein [Nocardiopsis]OOC53349.1 caunorubicin/doxorubicin resistance ATP-binding protein [Nocardiopsis sinuspersici]
MTSDSGPAIETVDLKKSFASTRAVDGLDLNVPRGAVYGLLGPNGCGKTTTIRLLSTLIRPDSGAARVLGHDVVTEADTVRSRISLTGQSTTVDEELTGGENLVLAGLLRGLRRGAARERAEQLLDAFDLAEAANRLLRTYSGGERRRIDIAASIVVTPDLLFLDEPTTGLDPRSRSRVWDIIRVMVDTGTTVLLTTQYLEEADRLARNIAFLDRGRVVARGTPKQIREAAGNATLRLGLHDPRRRGEAEDLLRRDFGARTSWDPETGRLSVSISEAGLAAEAVTRLSQQGVEVSDFAADRPSLDEAFLAMTGYRATTAEREEEEAIR